MNDLEFLRFITFKMFYSVVCGLIVGFERKRNGSPAGFKTQILVCVGSMLFTVSPMMVSPNGVTETARVIAQIISGVGFLGAGAIFNKGANNVTGLTTAAWIWFTAALGILIGLEHGPSSVFIAASLVAVIMGTRRIEIRYFSKPLRDRAKSEVIDIRKAS